MNKLIFAALVIGILGILIARLNTIQNDSNAIDQLQVLLLPVKKMLQNEPYISLVTTRSDKALYYQTQFILTPTVVEFYKADHDTIVYLQQLGKEKVKLPKQIYDTLFSAFDEKYELLLLSKNQAE